MMPDIESPVYLLVNLPLMPVITVLALFSTSPENVQLNVYIGPDGGLAVGGVVGTGSGVTVIASGEGVAGFRVAVADGIVVGSTVAVAVGALVGPGTVAEGLVYIGSAHPLTKIAHRITNVILSDTAFFVSWPPFSVSYTPFERNRNIFQL